MLKIMLIFSPHEIKEIRISESGKFLLVESRIRENFDRGFRNHTLTIRIQNPSYTDKGWNPVTQWYLESRIQDCLGFQANLLMDSF